jgi:hypothetical protein
MAVSNGQFTVGLTPVPIDGRSEMPYRILIQNMDHSADAYIGNENVTITNGYRLAKGEVVQLVVNPLDTIYVVSNKTGHRMCWIRDSF